jgi:hypothetical protein
LYFAKLIMEIKSLTITQYLIQGNPDGLVASYVSNWTGQCLKFPRNLLSIAKEREEFKKAGIYFLIGYNLNELDKWRVYIGESEGLDTRVLDHERDLKKDFWEVGVVFSSKDENLTKGHVRYLEYRLIELLREQKRIQVDNVKTTQPRLPEASIAEMETYLQYIKLLMPVIGFPFFDKPKQGDLGVKQQNLYLKVGTITAEGFLTPKGIVVRKGSQISQTETPAISGNYGLLRKLLSEQGIVANGFFIKDYEFTSPSGAGAVIMGYNINGRDAWKTKDHITINQLENL